MTIFKTYLIQCITNLHVGSGDAGYGIIDKMVQRDPVTNYPTIHASSLKGALREHFECNYKTQISVEDIFGKETNEKGDSETGTHRFFNADLIALPVRATHLQFVLGFDKKLADFINQKSKSFIDKPIFKLTIKDDNNYIYGIDEDVFAEDYELRHETYTNPFCFDDIFLNKKFATFQTKNFETLTKNLPVIARNKVGENKNLWYEEIVPHQTLFLTFIGATKHDDAFNKALTNDLIQIGANSSVGYGYCKFYEINPKCK